MKPHPVAVEEVVVNAAPAAPVSVKDQVKAIAKKHGRKFRDTRLKRGVYHIGRQSEWLTKEKFEAIVADVQQIKGARISMLDVLRDNSNIEFESGLVMVDVISVHLLH